MYNRRVYPWTRQQAEERGELGYYEKSLRKNNACAHALQKYVDDGMTDPDIAVSVISKRYGQERLCRVLSNTVQLSDDGRFSAAAAGWAGRYDHSGAGKERSSYAVLGHPARIDNFVLSALRLLEKQREAFLEAGGKPQKYTGHYKDILDGTPGSHTYESLIISPGLLGYRNTVCLINSEPDYTGFEEVPEDVRGWLDSFPGWRPHLFPTLERHWGRGDSFHAFAFHYEVGHEGCPEEGCEYAGYEEQLSALKDEAVRVARALPDALVRLSVAGGIHGRHELEILFPYPTKRETVMEAARTLETRFADLRYTGVNRDAQQIAQTM